MNPSSVPQSKDWTHILIVALSVFIILEVVLLGFMIVEKATAPATTTTTITTTQPSTNGTPKVQATSVVGSLVHVWDIDFLPTGEMLFTERGGALSIYKNKQVVSLAQIEDVAANGEGGLMGLAVDPKFTQNKYVYTCLNTTAGDIRVARWTINADASSAQSRKDIVTGIPANPSGRHSGCQLAFGPDGYLWVGTGDTAQDLKLQSPQDPQSLAGKILRVDRNGMPAPGNYSAPFDKRVYSFGHRNTQGIAFFEKEQGGVVGVSVEHGSDVDDELNPLKPGNFGWAPPNGPYNEANVPMTDKDKFPSAINALWVSGDPTQAPSGVAVLKGDKWKSWDGAIVMAMLKAERLNVLTFDEAMDVKKVSYLAEKDASFGRLRAATLGPDGNLYVGTSNGSDDKIIKFSPQQ
ncbi:MAG TPA: PQQ-dependent sugar dehydrogenase [Candidatus Saccharimonadales bacterium]|nr:PQQ-dependent sugar dehydrogenase [Candidatus Saccharimonadales bacterium]